MSRSSLVTSLCTLFVVGCSDQDFVSDIPLRVVATSPSGNATDIGRGAAITITFSEKLKAASVQEGVRLERLTAGDPQPLEATVAYSDEPVPTVTLTPTRKLAFSSRFRVSVATTVVRARDGGPLPVKVSWTFETGSPPPFRVDQFTPADASSGAMANLPLKIRFSEPPDCDSVRAGLTVTEAFDAHPHTAGAAAVVPGTWACTQVDSGAEDTLDGQVCDTTPGTCLITFAPADATFRFKASSNVTVALAATVASARATSTAGQLTGPTAATFRIEDPAPLALISSSPGNGASWVAISPQPELQLALSEVVDCASVSSTTVGATVTDAAGVSTSWPFTLRCTAGQVFFTLVPSAPATPLPYQATVRVTLQGGLFGTPVLESARATTRGGQLPSDLLVSFTTEEAPGLRLSTATPAGGSIHAAVNDPLTFDFSDPLDCTSVSSASVKVDVVPPVLESGAAPAPAYTDTCVFTCPAASNDRRVACAHGTFPASAQVTTTLLGAATAAGSLRSVAGNVMRSPGVAVSFRAEDPQPLVVIGSAPNGNPGNNVSANTDVRFTFSRPVRCAQLSNTTLPRLQLVQVDTGAVVPGTITCVDGSSSGPNVNGTVAVFRPSSPLTVLKRYRARALGGIVAADATVADGTVWGQLPQNVEVEFVISYENLEVLDTSPVAFAQLVSVGSAVSLQFNQELTPGTLVPCTPSVQTGCNVFLNRGATSTQASALPVDAVTYDSNTFTWTMNPNDPANAPFLEGDVNYTMTVRGGAPGPLGANGVSRLPVDFTFTFRTSSGQLVLSSTPQNLTTGVRTTAPVCVEFVNDIDVTSLTAGGTPQLTLSYQDTFGRAAAVPLDPATPYTVSGTSGRTANYVCLNITVSPFACDPGTHRLRAFTTYTGNVSTSVLVGGTPLTPAFSWTFTTRLPPQLSTLRKQNIVISEPFAASETEVPINAAFVIAFAEPMSASSLTSANLRLVPLDGSPAVVTTVTTDGLPQPLSAVLTTPGLGYLTGTTGRYAVELLGGTGGVTGGDGTPLANDVRVSFTTSPAAALTISPPEASLTPNVLIPVVSTRDLWPPSVTSSNVLATRAGLPINGTVALQVAQPRGATYIANPTWLTNDVGPFVVRTTTGVLDFRGNPVPPATTPAYSSGNTPSSAAVAPTALAAANVAAGTAPQTFVITTGGTGLKERMLATSYFSSPPGQPDGTVSLVAVGGAGCPAAGTRLSLVTVLAPSTVAANPDRVQVSVREPPYMRAGCQYVFTLRQSATANVYNQSGGADFSTPFTGESTAPTLLSLEVQRVDGTFGPLNGTTNASGRAQIRATFSEAMEPSSFAGSTFAIAGATGTFAVAGAVAVWTPNASLLPGANYGVSVGAVRDLANNALGGSTQNFTVENLTPTFTAVSWSGTSTRQAPRGTATLTFSEPVDPATITCDTTLTRGGISVRVAGNVRYGCGVLSAVDPRQVLWRPADPLTVGQVVDISVNLTPAVPLRDLAGTAVAGSSRIFTP